MYWRLHRYLAGSALTASLSGIGLFVFILITGNAMRDIVVLVAEGSLPLGLFFQLLGLLVPYAVSFAMPLGMLVAILLIMGRMSSNLELTAMRSAGISLWTIAAPILAVSLLGSSLALYINAYHAPAARASYKDILNDLVRTDPLRFIVPRKFIHDFPGYVIYVAEKEGESLRSFWLWELDEEKRAMRLLRADLGRFSFNENEDALVLTLEDGYTELRDEDNPDDLQSRQPTLMFDQARIRLPLENILGMANRPRDISQLTANALLESRSQLLAKAEEAEDPETREDLEVRAMRAQYHLSRNLAMAFSVFSLSLLGIPLGIQVSRSETYANIGVGLIIALTYYLWIVIIGWTETMAHLRPDLLIWIPNIVCQIVGFIWLWRANR